MFSLVQRNFPQNVEILPCLAPHPHPIDDRVTASRSRRLRVLLTGRHGNLATSLQWPKVDGLRAGAPEQTEQKSVHARTRNWTCDVRRALRLSFTPLSLSLRLSVVLSLLVFFSLSSRRVAFRIASRTRAYVLMVFVSLYPGHPDSRWRRSPEAEVEPLTVTLWSDSIDFVAGEAIVKKKYRKKGGKG